MADANTRFSNQSEESAQLFQVNMAGIQEVAVDVNFDQITHVRSSKKRRTNHDQWKKQRIKKSKATGQEPVNHVGQIIPERTSLNMICRCNCGEKLSEVEKTEVLKSFNDMANHQKQNIYLRGCVRQKDDNHIRRRGQKTNKEVRSSFEYFIPVGSSQIKVCKASFCALHGVKEARLKKKVLNFKETLQDNRGRHGNHKKLDENIRGSIRHHIASFPARESHYRKRTYLDSNLSVAEMYRLFQQKYPEYKDQSLEWVYRDIFNYEFNISFGFPRTDICDTCEKLNAQIALAKANGDVEKAKSLHIEHEVHVRKGDTFNESIKEMTAIAKEDKDIAVVCMDFQKNLLLPVTGIGQEYYKRQLAVHNLGIHDCVSGNATMYIYPENFAGKGPNEVISCLEYYILKLPESIKQLVLFSDNCFSQNKNRYLTSLGEAIHNSEMASNKFLPLKKAKYDDVQDLISHVHLPASVTFYSSLTHSEQGVSAEEELILDE